MNIWESMRSAFQSLLSNKLRMFLTMLGIVIGISSVITISSVGAGVQNSITGDLTSTGYGNFDVVVDSTSDNYKKSLDFDNKDVEIIKNIEGIEAVSAVLEERVRFTNNKREDRGLLEGTNKSYEKINGVEILYGRFFLDDEFENKSKVAMIDNLMAESYFGSIAGAIGEEIEFKAGGPESSDGKSNAFTIVGVFKNQMAGVGSVFGFTPRQARIPDTIYEKLLNVESYSTIEARATNNEEIDSIMEKVVQSLEQENNVSKVYETSLSVSNASSLDNVLSTLNYFIIFIALISLFVGGIGVMNIMLVSVTERIKEIGIRKAIGATNKNILYQFLIESVIISILGGIIGLIFGIVGAYIVYLVIGIKPIFSILIIIIAILVSALIGIISGVYPARRASLLNPVDALRTE